MGWQRFGLHAVLVLSSVVMLTPMVWLIAATIKGPDDLSLSLLSFTVALFPL